MYKEHLKKIMICCCFCQIVKWETAKGCFFKIIHKKWHQNGIQICPSTPLHSSDLILGIQCRRSQSCDTICLSF
jgi:hypothetical protein